VLSGFKATAYPSEVEDMKAIAHLPGLDIEILHRQLPDGQGEQISINFTAVPSFDAFANLEAFNPFALWAEAMRLAWSPWVEATRAVMLPAPLPKLRSEHRSDLR
jgi:hypothetical protein